MSRVIVTESHLSDIANAIRGRTGGQTTYAPGQMAAAVAALPNAYAAADEGKVVQSGALAAQGSDTVTENGTVDTTLISSLTVNVAGGGGGSLDVYAFADNQNTSSATGQSASITTTENYSAVTIVVLTANTGTYIPPTLSVSGGVSIIQDQTIGNFYYTRNYIIMAHALNVPSGTVFTASALRNSASPTLLLFGIT